MLTIEEKLAQIFPQHKVEAINWDLVPFDWSVLSDAIDAYLLERELRKEAARQEERMSFPGYEDESYWRSEYERALRRANDRFSKLMKQQRRA